jgi:hypothetical protein
MATSQTDSYSAWAVGWAAFAAVMMIILGIANAFQGIVALANEEFYVVGQEWIFEFNVTTWGWIHLLGGIIVAIAGFGIFTGSVAARTVGVIIAGLSILWNFAWLPYYPIWSVILIAVAVAVIWALTAHGRELAEQV